MHLCPAILVLERFVVNCCKNCKIWSVSEQHLFVEVIKNLDNNSFVVLSNLMEALPTLRVHNKCRHPSGVLDEDE